jgi:hypothetical protein
MIAFQGLQWQTQSSRVVEQELGFWTHVRRCYGPLRLVRITRSRPGHCQRPPGQALVISGWGPGHSGWDGNSSLRRPGWPVHRCRPGAWAARGRSNEPDPTRPAQGHWQATSISVTAARFCRWHPRVSGCAPGPAAAGAVRRQSRAPSAGPAADAAPTGAHARLAPSPTARRGPARRGRRRCQLEFQPLNLKLHGGTPSPGGPVADTSGAPPRRHASRKITSHKAAVAVASA